MISMDEARSRVARGAAHLDTVKPGWFRRIDTGTLTLHDPCGCIVGQLCRSRPERDRSGSYFSDSQLAELGLIQRGTFTSLTDEEYDALVSYLGFDMTVDECEACDDCDEYAVLQDAWIEAIAARLHPVTAPEIDTPIQV